MLTFNNILILSFPMLMLAAAISDILTLRVSNLIIFATVALFFVAAYRAGLPRDQLLMSATVFVGCLIVGFIAFSQGWIGGADGKLLAAMGLWLGLDAMLPAVILASFVAGGMGILILVVRRYDALPLPKFLAVIVETKTIPYTAALGAGALFFYPESRIWAAFYS